MAEDERLLNPLKELKGFRKPRAPAVKINMFTEAEKQNEENQTRLKREERART